MCTSTYTLHGDLLVTLAAWVLGDEKKGLGMLRLGISGVHQVTNRYIQISGGEQNPSGCGGARHRAVLNSPGATCTGYHRFLRRTVLASELENSLSAAERPVHPSPLSLTGGELQRPQYLALSSRAQQEALSSKSHRAKHLTRPRGVCAEVEAPAHGGPLALGRLGGGKVWLQAFNPSGVISISWFPAAALAIT